MSKSGFSKERGAINEAGMLITRRQSQAGGR